MKKAQTILASAATAMAMATGAMAQETQTEMDTYQAVAEACTPINNAVINNQGTDLEQAISCAEAIGNYTVYSDKAIATHINDMPNSFKKGIYIGTRARCLAAFEQYANTGHKKPEDSPTLEERRVRASHINEISYACLAFSHGNINGDVLENTDTVILPKQHVQTVVDTAYCVAKALGTTAYNDGSYDNATACRKAKQLFN